MYKDKKGEAISFLDWVNKVEDENYRMIKRTKINNNVWVSTLWTGIDGDGKGRVFETHVIGIGTQRRTSSEEEAVKVHDEMVRSLHLQ